MFIYKSFLPISLEYVSAPGSQSDPGGCQMKPQPLKAKEQNHFFVQLQYSPLLLKLASLARQLMYAENGG